MEQGIANNRRNGISVLNPLRGYYLEKADQEFGALPPREWGSR